MSDLVTMVSGAFLGLSSVGRTLFERVIEANVWTAMLLAGALLLDRALAPRTRASWRIALYAPVFVRMLLPHDWSLHLADSSDGAAFLAPLLQVGAHAAGSSREWTATIGYGLLAAIYFDVVIVLGLAALIASLRLDHALRSAEPTGSHFANVPVLEHASLGPLVTGLFAPRIVLPRRLLAFGEEQTLACVLRHEAAHVARRDAWLSFALRLATIVLWPIVPLWIAASRVHLLIEVACDEAATLGSDPNGRRRYGHALLDMAEWQPRMVAPLGSSGLYFGSALRTRIEALAFSRHWPRAVQLLALAPCPFMLLAACGVATPTPATNTRTRDYTYNFAPSPANDPAPPSSAGRSTSSPDGRLPHEVIQQIVRSRSGEFRACYEGGLKRQPKLEGTVTVRFIIGMDGATQGADSDGSTLPDHDVVRCVVGEFQKLTYPKPEGGVVTVVYPLLLTPPT